MKSFKLPIVLLTALFALQTVTADAFFGNTFSRLAAFGKTQTSLVKSFFNTTGRTFAAKAAAHKKAILLPGFVVAGSVAAWQGKKLLPTAKAEGAKVEPSVKPKNDAFAFRRYMVAQFENIGVAKTEKCKNLKLSYSDYKKAWELDMYCPKQNQVLDALYQAKLTEHKKQQETKSQFDIAQSISFNFTKQSTEDMAFKPMENLVEDDTLVFQLENNNEYKMNTRLTHGEYDKLLNDLKKQA